MKERVKRKIRELSAMISAIMRHIRREKRRQAKEQEELFLRKKKEEDWIADTKAREKFERAYRQSSAYRENGTEKATVTSHCRQRNGR